MRRMQHVRQWTDCLPDNDGKRPRLGPDLKKVPDSQRLNYQGATEEQVKRNNSSNIGFIFTKYDSYFGIDVDTDPSGQDKRKPKAVPRPVFDFIQQYPTHVHVSPSGNGLHIIYKLNEWDQTAVNELRSIPNQSIEKGDVFTGELKWHNQFLTVTSNLHQDSTPDGAISEISLITLQELIPNLLSHTHQEYEKTAAIDIKTGLPLHVETVSFKPDDLQMLLASIPPTFNHTARKAIERLKFPLPLASNYDWWVTVGSACACAALELERVGDQVAVEAICTHFIDWSSHDEEGFVSASDVRKKFYDLLRSTETKEYPLSFPVLKKLAGLCHIQWPVINAKTGLPINTEVINVEALVAHHDMKFLHDMMSGSLIVRGPEPVIRKFFCPKPSNAYKLYRPKGESQHFPGKKALSIAFLAFLQAQGYAGMTATVATTLAHHLLASTTPMDYFAVWVESTPWDGVPRLESVINTMQFSDENEENRKVYRMYLRKSIYALVGMHFHDSPFADVSSFLVLKGLENTRKSSWLRCLLPGPVAEKYMAFPLTEGLLKNTDNLMRLLGQKAITIVDECDRLFTPRGEATLKSLVSQTADSRRRLYEEEVEHFKRFGVVIGTTNQSSLYIGDKGSRKIWQIPVKSCNTETLYRIDMQQAYAEALKHLRDFASSGQEMNLMWTQNKEEVKKTNALNIATRKQSDLEISLAELFGDLKHVPPFDPEELRLPIKELRGTRLWPSMQLRRLLEMNLGIRITSVKVFNEAVARYCGAYTNTIGQGIEIPSMKSKYMGYVVIDGCITYNSRQLYVTPPLLNDED